MMSRERELLEEVISGDNRGDFFVSHDLYKEVHEFLAQPEQEPIAWIMHNKETGYRVQAAYRPSALKKGWEAIPLYAGSPKREQEQHGTQYLLDQVSMLTAENAMLKEKWSTQKRERINHDDILDRSINGSFEYRDGFMDGVMFAENHHSIGGGE